MSDIVAEFILPSNGLLYDGKVQFKNQIRAPRLKDKGLGDSTTPLKLQASILDKTILQPLGMSAYDLHTADFVYLNFIQRRLSKGSAPYKVSVTCPRCLEKQLIEVPLDELEVEYLTPETIPNLKYTTLKNEELQLTFITPRMLDESVDNANAFKEEYKETELSLSTLRTRELLRFLIVSVDGVKLGYPKMTDFLDNMYADDVDNIMEKLSDFDFGLQTRRETVCTRCGKKFFYTVPVG